MNIVARFARLPLAVRRDIAIRLHLPFPNEDSGTETGRAQRVVLAAKDLRRMDQLERAMQLAEAIGRRG
jgi:hypothetical protein